MFRFLTTHALALSAFALWPAIVCAQTQQIDNVQFIAGTVVTPHGLTVDQGHCPKGTTQYRTEKFNVAFKPPFGSAPTVMASISGFQIDHGRNANLIVKVESASSDHAVIALSTWCDTNIYWAQVSYVAFGPLKN
jgi:H-type lectin domain